MKRDDTATGKVTAIDGVDVNERSDAEALIEQFAIGGPRFAVQQSMPSVRPPTFTVSNGVWKRAEESARGEAIVMCTGALLYDRPLERSASVGDGYEFRSLFSHVRDCLSSADLTVGSLGAVVAGMYPAMSTLPPKYTDGHYTNAPTEYLDALRFAGFDCTALANPFNLDAGVRGIAATEREVLDAGMVPSGLGQTKNPIFEINGIRIAVLSFTVNAHRADEWLTPEGASRLLNVHSEDAVRSAVTGSKEAGAQFVLAYLDCRADRSPLNFDARKEAARHLAECGADYIVCTRPPVVSRRIVHATSDGRSVPIVTGLGTFMAGPRTHMESPAAILKLVLRLTEDGDVEVADSYIPVRRFPLYRGVASPVVPAHSFYNLEYDPADFGEASAVVSDKLGKTIGVDPARTVTIDSHIRPQITPQQIGEALDTRFSKGDERRMRNVKDVPVHSVAVQKEHLHEGCAAVLAKRTVAGIVPDPIGPEDAAAAGAALAIADSPVPSVPTLVVDDPGAAFVDIAATIRRRYSPLTIAVTGSAGKTTAMEMLAPVLDRRFQTLTVKGNYNTPRAAARMIQKLSDEDQAYIQEVHGGSPGTASVASRMIAPDIALVTSIGDAHLRQMGSIENVIEAKMQIIDGLVPGGTLVLNDDNEYLRSQELPVNTVRYSTSDPSSPYFATRIQHLSDAIEFEVVHPEGVTEVVLHSRGIHNVSNALAAFTVGRIAGVPVHTIVAGLSRYRTRSVRQNLVDVGGYRLFVDAYNSNPLSLSSAIDTLCDIPVREGGRRIAVLGDMGEQGMKSSKNHTAVGTHIGGAAVDLVLCSGKWMSYTADAVRAAGGAARHSPSMESLRTDVRDHVRPGDVILFKAAGSVDLVKNVVYPVFGKVV